MPVTVSTLPRRRAQLLGCAGAVFALLGLTVRSLSAAPRPDCLWLPFMAGGSARAPGTLTIQYLQLASGQPIDDKTAQIISQALGPDRTLHFRYEQDYPDDHVFPNGISMGEIHQWLTAMIDHWNQEPLMPLQLSLDRGQTDAQNVIKLDDDSSETDPNSGVGGASWSSDGTTTTYSSRAVLNVDQGSLNTRELMEFIAKHELGHCLTLAHSSNRAAAMGYSDENPDYWARVNYFEEDDLLGLRAIWDRDAPGFGALEGHLLYPDGSPVGGADVVAIDDSSGEVLAGNVTDGQDGGRFRIELPAGRQVRLIAHPLHADAMLFGEHFLPSELLTSGGFEPTEFQNGDQTAVYTVPDGETMPLDPVTVNPPADIPLMNKDAPVVAMLPGQRAHVAMRFDGLGSDPVTVTPSLTDLTISNVAQMDDRVEFDVTAASTAHGASTVEVQSGSAANLQVGSLWVRPLDGLVMASNVEPQTLAAGGATDVTVSGYGLDQVTDVRVISESSLGELPAHLEGTAANGDLMVSVDAPADAAAGPWDIQLQTADGAAPQPPEPRPRLWVAQGRIQTDPLIDLGDIPVGQPVDLNIHLTNVSSDSYTVSSDQWSTWQGKITVNGNLIVSPVDPGADDTLHLNITPTQLGPTVVTFGWLENRQLDAVTQVRLWAVPASN